MSALEQAPGGLAIEVVAQALAERFRSAESSQTKPLVPPLPARMSWRSLAPIIAREGGASASGSKPAKTKVEAKQAIVRKSLKNNASGSATSRSA
jgi:hypothetical protein